MKLVTHLSNIFSMKMLCRSWDFKVWWSVSYCLHTCRKDTSLSNQISSQEYLFAIESSSRASKSSGLSRDTSRSLVHQERITRRQVRDMTPDWVNSIKGTAIDIYRVLTVRRISAGRQSGQRLITRRLIVFYSVFTPYVSDKQSDVWYAIHVLLNVDGIGPCFDVKPN